MKPRQISMGYLSNKRIINNQKLKRLCCRQVATSTNTFRLFYGLLFLSVAVVRSRNVRFFIRRIAKEKQEKCYKIHNWKSENECFFFWVTSTKSDCEYQNDFTMKKSNGNNCERTQKKTLNEWDKQTANVFARLF